MWLVGENYHRQFRAMLAISIVEESKSISDKRLEQYRYSQTQMDGAWLTEALKRADELHYKKNNVYESGINTSRSFPSIQNPQKCDLGLPRPCMSQFRGRIHLNYRPYDQSWVARWVNSSLPILWHIHAWATRLVAEYPASPGDLNFRSGRSPHPFPPNDPTSWTQTGPMSTIIPPLGNDILWYLECDHRLINLLELCWNPGTAAVVDSIAISLSFCWKPVSRRCHPFSSKSRPCFFPPFLIYPLIFSPFSFHHHLSKISR